MTREKEIIIAKLGGSIVTLKYASQPAIRRVHISRIAHVIKNHYNPSRHHLILIHGAGSFGHLHAHRHKLDLGTKNNPERLFRAVENQSLDARLNSEIVSLFVKTGLPVVGFLTRSIAFNKNGFLQPPFLQIMEAALHTGAIPLLHGDMIFDTSWGLSIVSGDTLLAALAEHFCVKKVFFASDVDGIHSKDPHRFPSSPLLPEISLSDLNKEATLGISHNHDVTGGLSKKFLHFQKNSSIKDIYFFNGLDPKNFIFFFNQEHFYGTVIKKKK